MLNRRDECLKRWSSARIVLAFALAAAFVSVYFPVRTAFAQVTAATILGNVVDPGGAAVPGATVTVTNTSTGAQVKATAGSDGSYIVPDLSISGLYTVTIGAPSFRTFEQKGIVLQVNQNARVDASLQLGSTTQTVEVTGQPPQVDTASTALGEVISHQQVSELPLNGRNPTQLVTLATGVTTATTPAVLAWRGGSYWSSNGTRSDENAILLNGALYEGAYFNNGLNLPSPDALEEFKLITNTYSAEYGRNAGSVLNAVVKSGTNRFHGDAWDFWRNNDLNARNFFLNQPGAQVAKLNQNQFGVTAGGPIIKNKFFIFGGYQGLRIAQNSTNSGFLPTPNELAGYFTEPAGQVLNNPATGTAFPLAGGGYPANTYLINPTSYNPIATNLVSTYLQPPGVNPTTGFITTLGSAPTTNNQYLLKGDYNIKSSNKLNFMWMRDRTKEVSPFFGGTVPTYDTETPYTHITLYTLNDTQTIRANLLNEFRASYTRLLDVLGCNKQFSANSLGINYTPDGAPENPDFNVSGYFGLSSVGLCNLSEGTPTREINDTVSWVKGKHDLKFGGQWFKNTNVIFAAYLAEGNFNFNGSFTNNALADFLLGDVSLYQRQTEGDGALISNEGSAFAEDNWKVSRKLTLNLGLRYFTQQPWYATAGGIAFTAHGGDGQWDPGFTTSKFQNAPPDVLFPGDVGPRGRIPKGMYPEPNMFEPRIGLAWDPKGDGKTSIRASYGMFHDIVVVDAIAQAGSVQPYIYREKFNNPAGGLTNPYLNEPDPWPYTAYLSSTPTFILPATAAALDGNTTNPFIQAWTFDVQHQVTENWMVEAAYVGKASDHLIVDMDANEPIFVPGVDATGAPLSSLANENQRRPYYNDGWETISNVGSWGRGSYHGLELSTQYRVRHGLFFQAGYTFSHGIDTNSNYNVAASNQIQDSYCLACEKGNSDNDRRNVFVASWIYNLPTPFSSLKGGGGMVGRNLLGHWEFSGIARLLSGAPFTCEEGSDRSLTGDGNDRCTITGNWSLPGGRSHGSEVNEWFNTAAFTETPLGNFGNSGRNQLTGPWQRNVDLGILRNFPISERFGTVQFRAEFFNAFNFVNFGNPNNTFASGGFGQITSAGSPRLIQLALKYDW